MTENVTSNLIEVVANLRVAQGETDNIMSAALRDVALEIEKHIRTGWPVDTGKSYRGWATTVNGLNATILNDVDYTSYVHKGLAETLFEEGLQAAQMGGEALLSERVKALLEKPTTGGLT